jgi:DNA-binding MarR family transcriptional regulator
LARQDFLSRLEGELKREGHDVLAPSLVSLASFIDLEGTRSTELARRLGISKQAVGQAVAVLEAKGLVSRTVDSADGRAFLVVFTDHGINRLVQTYQAIRRIERAYDTIVGAERMRTTRAVLEAISYGIEPR